jgi:hypothetical protein
MGEANSADFCTEREGWGKLALCLPFSVLSDLAQQLTTTLQELGG